MTTATWVALLLIFSTLSFVTSALSDFAKSAGMKDTMNTLNAGVALMFGGVIWAAVEIVIQVW